MKRLILFGFAICSLCAAGTLDQARELYHRTQYRESLALLQQQPQKQASADARVLQLMGQDYFMVGEYKKATEIFEKTVALEPSSAVAHLWLGRSWGRRAETASFFTAPGYASKARQNLEKSVELDPANKDATGDLMDFYLSAPGFLGGGIDKAEALAKTIGKTDPAEGHYAEALIDDHRKQYDAAEQHLQRAAELAPKQVGRVLAVAKYLAKRGRIQESETMFDRAATMAPGNPKVLFERADTYVKQRRNLNQARELLEKYVHAPLTPEDAPREQAEALLKKIGA